MSAAATAPEKFYAYWIKDVTGTQVGKTKVGEFLLEREFKGNGLYTWTIYNFAEGSCVGALSGTKRTRSNRVRMNEQSAATAMGWTLFGLFLVGLLVLGIFVATGPGGTS